MIYGELFKHSAYISYLPILVTCPDYHILIDFTILCKSLACYKMVCHF